MECFNHAAAAVGICKNCGRGLCRACSRDLGAVGIACSDACATEISEFREINERAKQIYGVGSAAKRRWPLAAMMWAAFALLFGGFGLYEYVAKGHIDGFLALFGLLCLVFSVATYVRIKALKLNY